VPILKIASWNINSVRLRIDLVTRFLASYQPDILCLQETKVVNDQFPETAFRKIGYGAVAVNGQKAYHGVAIVSRLPFAAVQAREFCAKGDARHLSVTLGSGEGGVEVHNFYVPSGGDEPDPQINEKFAHKLAFLNEMQQWFEQWRHQPPRPRILLGDLNVAPLEHDVWSHKQLLNIVSHTPIEIEHLGKAQAAHGWIDVARRFIPPEEKHYTWWSYRAIDWRQSNRGRRLDHIWVSPSLGDGLLDYTVAREARDWDRTSDHAPVMATLTV